MVKARYSIGLTCPGQQRRVGMRTPRKVCTQACSSVGDPGRIERNRVSSSVGDKVVVTLFSLIKYRSYTSYKDL